MLAAVVPVKNEEKKLPKTLATLLSMPFDLIIAVVNGSSDNSYNILQNSLNDRIIPVHFAEALGFDVPRAVGAKTALVKGAGTVLFIDGDMDGELTENIQELVELVQTGRADMALTDCYYGKNLKPPSKLASHVLQARQQLNTAIGLVKDIGTASPSHGPHAISRNFLLAIPLRELAIPPVALALAAKMNFIVSIGTRVPNDALGSPVKNARHSSLIAATIIGDCMEAINVYRGRVRQRICRQIEYDGYHSQRRWDLLENYLGVG
ncbi:MAG: glycosyltransferase family 2 protein [Peptococcaceae bacterium]|nr:glycosyltransferase family 2 protein [Peptococcaceae bacterium]